ncbi:hypothetical protein HUS23_13420 [Ectothiorhodospiraceae bacterium 2226]|nr:hypothetical protein HUS23_13420 [Ectothiorhodospiraceae bacterium 2226]
MPHTRITTTFCIGVGVAATLVSTLLPAGAGASEHVVLESGALWQSRNDVRIPGDSGDRFALDDITGAGPFLHTRVTVNFALAERHSLRLVYAPLTISESGVLSEPVAFAGENFEAGPVRARYQFNAPRVTWRYALSERDDRRLWIGFTGLVRDAEVHLRQDGRSARDTDIGFVPLLHFAGEYALTPRWQLEFDFDGLAAPQGRAFDLGVRLAYQLDADWQLFGGYRMLEGGVDNDNVYNFAWFNYLTIGATRHF